MRHSFLSFLLMLLIAGQSVIAMADFHLIEQNSSLSSNALINDICQPLEVLEESAAKQITATTSESSVCIDCNDCYCCAFVMLSDVAFTPSADVAESLLTEYDSTQNEAPNFSLLRPPKT